MSSPDLSGGLPKPWLDSQERSEAMQTLYGNFAFSVLVELEGNYTGFPQDIITVGDNWFQLVETHDTPNGEGEEFLYTQGARLFGDQWPIMDRSNQDLRNLLSAFREGVRAGSLDDRILEEIAVLDRTSIAHPLFESTDISQVQTQPWGQLLQLKGLKTNIFHITDGYTRKIIVNLGGSTPGDEVSGSIYLNEI